MARIPRPLAALVGLGLLASLTVACSGGSLPEGSATGTSTGTDTASSTETSSDSAGTTTSTTTDGGSGSASATGTGTGGTCVPGMSVACACPDGGTGAQVCNAEGSGYEPCECAGSSDSTTSASGTTTDSTTTDSTTTDATTDSTTDATTTTGDLCEDPGPEPNETREDSVDLGMQGCNDEAEGYTGVLNGDADVDWHTYAGMWGQGCGFGDPNTVTTVTATDAVRICVYAECFQGNADFQCPNGSDQDAVDGIDGCCGQDELAFTFNCSGTNNESGRFWIRLDQAPADACVEYSVDYDFNVN